MSVSKEELARLIQLLALAGGDRSDPALRKPPDPTGCTWDTLARALPPLPWDWPGWLPCGFLTILASEPGAGKSLLCLRLAACYTDGRPWPDGSPFDRQRGQVLWCESEASQTLNVERAQRWGLDLTQIVSPLNNPLYNFNLDDERHLNALLAHGRRDSVRFVVLDSLRGLQSKAGGGGAGIRAVILLADVARIIAKPVLLTHHLRKRTFLDEAGRPTLDRLRGSGIITEAARLVWTLDTPDLADPGHRRLSVIKNNLAPPPDPIGMKIDDRGLRFGPPPQPPAALTELERAVDFLRLRLALGPLPANQLLSESLALGLSERTCRRAKRLMSVLSIKLPGKTGWYWRLPTHLEDGQADPLS